MNRSSQAVTHDPRHLSLKGASSWSRMVISDELHVRNRRRTQAPFNVMFLIAIPMAEKGRGVPGPITECKGVTLWSYRGIVHED